LNSTRVFATRGQNAPGNWSYQRDYAWPFVNELPVQGFDQFKPPTWFDSPPVDSPYTVRIKVERSNDNTGFNVYANGSSTSFFVEDFERLTNDPTDVSQTYAIHALGMRRDVTRFWASDRFVGVPAPRPSTSTSTSSTGTSTSSTGTGNSISTSPSTSGVGGVVLPPGGPLILGPVLAAMGGGIIAAVGAALAYYSVFGGAVVDDGSESSEEDDLEDNSEIDDPSESVAPSAEAELDSLNAENYVDVDPDNSFWRATTLDAYA